MYRDRTDSLETLFQNRLLQIPNYQRGYAWEEKQWQALVDDLALLPVGRDHYTGTVVLHLPSDMAQKTDRAGQMYDVLYVVDGQQRLTTAILFLDVLRHEMKQFPRFNPVVAKLEETYIRVLDSAEQHIPRLRLNQDCHDFYYGRVLGQKTYVGGAAISSHRRLEEARAFFERYLAKQRDALGATYEDWLEEVSNKIRHRLRILVHTINREADVGVIFETMNNRGKDITDLEKIKNYLLYLSSKLHLSEEHIQLLGKQINTVWSHVFMSLMAAGLESEDHENSLLRAHWTVIYGAKSWQRSDSVKSKFHLRNYDGSHERRLQEIQTYLETLQNSVTAYCDIYAPTHSNAFNAYAADPDIRQQIRNASVKLTRLGIIVNFLPLLIAVRLKYPNQAQTYLDTVGLCEKFAFRVYRLQGSPSRTARTKFNRYANNLYRGSDLAQILDDVRRALLNNYCSDAQMRQAFQLQEEENDWYHWSGIQYFLYEYEHYLAGDKDVKIAWSDIQGKKQKTIEHILPRTPDEQGYWNAHFTSEERKKYLHDLGNLCLTQDNSWLSNKPFPDKKGKPGHKKGYVNSALYMERRLAGYDEWTAKELLARRAAMVQWALERWHVTSPPPRVKPGKSWESLLHRAQQRGIGNEFQAIYDLSQQHKLYPKINKNSIEYRPPQSGRYTLLTVWPDYSGLWVRIRHHNFTRAYKLPKEQVSTILGEESWQWITADTTDGFIKKLSLVFQEVAKLKEGDA